MKTTTSVTMRMCPVPGSMTTPGNASTATPPQRRHAPSATGEGMPKQNWNNTSKKPGTGPPTNPSRSRTNLRNGKSSPTAPKIPHDGLRRKAAHRLHRLVGLLLPPQGTRVRSGRLPGPNTGPDLGLRRARHGNPGRNSGSTATRSWSGPVLLQITAARGPRARRLRRRIRQRDWKLGGTFTAAAETTWSTGASASHRSVM